MTSRPGRPGDESAWRLNGNKLGGGKMPLRMDGETVHFEASQRFQLIEIPEDDDRRTAGRLRVRTTEYAYNLTMPTGTLSWHWHPTGRSDEHRPHMHLPDDPRGHYPTPRFSIEEVIEWVIQRGVDPAHEDWEQRLMETDGIHKLYRSWTDTPPTPE